MTAPPTPTTTPMTMFLVWGDMLDVPEFSCERPGVVTAVVADVMDVGVPSELVVVMMVTRVSVTGAGALLDVVDGGGDVRTVDDVVRGFGLVVVDETSGGVDVGPVGPVVDTE